MQKNRRMIAILLPRLLRSAPAMRIATTVMFVVKGSVIRPATATMIVGITTSAVLTSVRIRTAIRRAATNDYPSGLARRWVPGNSRYLRMGRGGQRFCQVRIGGFDSHLPLDV